MSHAICRPIQNAASVPKNTARRIAVSGVMERWPRISSFTRRREMPSSPARACWLMPRGIRNRVSRNFPGCAGARVPSRNSGGAAVRSPACTLPAVRARGLRGFCAVMAEFCGKGSIGATKKVKGVSLPGYTPFVPPPPRFPCAVPGVSALELDGAPAVDHGAEHGDLPEHFLADDHVDVDHREQDQVPHPEVVPGVHVLRVVPEQGDDPGAEQAERPAAAPQPL